MFGAFLLFEDDFIHIVSIAFTALILTELLMVALTVRTWHYLMIVGELLSLLLYIASLFIFHSFFGLYHIFLFDSFHISLCFCSLKQYPKVFSLTSVTCN